ncbi:OLC1v1000667C1 [Oldenlandia corymbosa var. corymbosa]|uniref:OLC1v1000667C1 n=1 Tax=Oldenlandia corymbosa var. corymbosa TaxID=529605 RepID=A0AAV1D3E2_OLDCO|nr:OLC1v1000667C1 [Oldenlandia corymbosa var. corymbosa]
MKLRRKKIVLNPLMLSNNPGGAVVHQLNKNVLRICEENFKTKMADDLHSNTILTGALADAMRIMNNSSDKLQKNHPGNKIMMQSVEHLIELEKEVRKILALLGLLSEEHSISEVLEQLKDKALKRADLTEEDVLREIQERAKQRKMRNYEAGDEIRKKLAARGIGLGDEGDQTIWTPCVPTSMQQQEFN